MFSGHFEGTLELDVRAKGVGAIAWALNVFVLARLSRLRRLFLVEALNVVNERIVLFISLMSDFSDHIQ